MKMTTYTNAVKVSKTYKPKNMADAIRKVCGIPEGLARNKMSDEQRKMFDRVSNVFRGPFYMAAGRGVHTDGTRGCYTTGDGIKQVVDFIMNAK